MKRSNEAMRAPSWPIETDSERRMTLLELLDRLFYYLTKLVFSKALILATIWLTGSVVFEFCE
jgi:hypothetical protein